jgi:uncharacterized protein (DUF885 family)
MILVIGLAAGWAAGQESPSPTQKPAEPRSSSAELNRLFEAYWEERLPLYPVAATMSGDHRYDDRLANDISEEHRAREREMSTRYLGQLKAFDASGLNARDRLNREVLITELEQVLETLSFDAHLLPVNQLGSLPIMLPQLGSGGGPHPFKTVQDYDNFLSRIRDFEVWVNTAVENMRAGIAKGLVQPKVVMEKVQPQLEAMIVSDPTKSVFYRPITNLPPAFPEPDRTRLRTEYAEAITRRIVPAYTRLHAFIRDEYLPKCRDTVAWSALPRGKDWYELQVRKFTTTRMGLDEILDLGVKEVERLRHEMMTVKEQAGFAGELPAFAEEMESAAKRWHSKPELIAAYERFRAKVEPQLPWLFRKMPAAPYEIRAVEEYREKSASSQYWSAAPDGSRPGIFYVNAVAMAKKPMLASEALFLHEAVPGHHFEISLKQEQTDQPRFRRFTGFAAYSEGWGLYCEGLGPELGCYTDPVQKMEWLAADMWRARRLVVDVGLHAKGWTREQARQYLLENPVAVMSADLEVDRYIANPGQALAYKVGERTLARLRAAATQRLGARFDLRDFHDVVLGEGPMPLGLLEARVQEWMNAAAKQ